MAACQVGRCDCKGVAKRGCAKTISFELELIQHGRWYQDAAKLLANEMEFTDDRQVEKRRRVADGKHQLTSLPVAY